MKTKQKPVNDNAILAFIVKSDRRIGQVMDKFDLPRTRAGLALKRLRADKRVRLVGKKRTAVWTVSAPKKSKKVAGKKATKRKTK